MSGPCSVSFPFSIGDPVRLKAVNHIGGTVSAMTALGGSAQRVKVRHFDAEGDSVDREFDATDLEGTPPVSPPPQPKASAGAPPSAANPGPTPTPKTQAVTVGVPIVHPAAADPADAKAADPKPSGGGPAKP